NFMKPTKVDIPEELKADLPPSRFGKILGATPVIMAVVATMLAGVASSEMTRAQYQRSLGAQQQSEAGGQWRFFQAKCLRGAVQHNTADLLQTVVEVHQFETNALRQLANTGSQMESSQSQQIKKDLLLMIDSPGGQQALALLQSGESPRTMSPKALDPK